MPQDPTQDPDVQARRRLRQLPGDEEDPQSRRIWTFWFIVAIAAIGLLVASFALYQNRLRKREDERASIRTTEDVREKLEVLRAQQATSYDPLEIGVIRHLISQEIKKNNRQTADKLRAAQARVFALTNPFADAAEAYSAKASAFFEPNKIARNWLKDVTATLITIDDARYDIKAIAEANDELTQAFRALIAELERRIEAPGTADDDRHVMTLMHDLFKRHADTICEFRDIQSLTFSRILALLELLRSEWGNWEYDARMGGIMCKTEALVDKTNEIMSSLRSLEEKQIVAQKEIRRALAGW